MNRELVERQGFKLLEQLSENSHTVIWKAVQTSLDRTVSLAVLKPEAAAMPSEISHFLAVSKMLAKIKSGSLASVFDIVSSGNLYYAVMESVDGPTLDECIAEDGPMSVTKALNIARSLAEGLSLLWKSEHVVHRNIKGQSIRLDPLGVAKITDFTLAIQAGPGVDATALDGGLIVGTPCFLSPEQVAGAHTLNTQTDMYSLGLLLYYLTTGQIPFDGGTVQSVLAEQVNGHLVPPNEISSDIPVAFTWFLHRLLMKNPADRYPAWPEVQKDISALLAGQPPSGIVPEDARPSTIDAAGLPVPEAALRVRLSPKKTDAEISAYQTKTLDEEHGREIRREKMAMQVVLWLLLVVWFGAFFWFRSSNSEEQQKALAPVFRAVAQIKGLIASSPQPANPSRPNVATGPANEPPAVAQPVVQPPAEPAATVAPPPELPPVPVALTQALAAALISGDLASAKDSLDHVGTPFKDADELRKLVAAIPSPDALVSRYLESVVGKDVSFVHKGKPARKLTIRSVAKGIVYVEANGRSAEVPIAGLTPEEKLQWMAPPEKPEDVAAYCMLLLQIPERKTEVAEFATKCPLLADALALAVIQTPAAK